jgi:hypothetical protein
MITPRRGIGEGVLVVDISTSMVTVVDAAQYVVVITFGALGPDDVSRAHGALVVHFPRSNGRIIVCRTTFAPEAARVRAVGWICTSVVIRVCTIQHIVVEICSPLRADDVARAGSALVAGDTVAKRAVKSRLAFFAPRG